ncbi:MAG: RagB/SusD family nutrient uptake outer membrane protein [Hymenobacter sp.]
MPNGQQTTANFYANADQCKAAVMGCYSLSDQDDWWKLDRSRMLGDAGSDDAWKGNAIAGDQREFGDFARFFWLPNNEWFDNRYTFLFQAIGNCNSALVGIGNSNIGAAVKQQLMGELKFIRAYNYFELVKGYGGVPLVLTPVSPNEAVSIPRASLADCYTQIIEDFQDAAAALPEKKPRPATTWAGPLRAQPMPIWPRLTSLLSSGCRPSRRPSWLSTPASTAWATSTRCGAWAIRTG